MLEGVKILDLSRLLPGPMASWYLRGLGAEVVKVEDPQVGDYLRYSPPFDAQGRSIWFTTINAGARSLALDLKERTAQEQLRSMLSTTDVLLESFRPGVMARLGLDPQALRAEYPHLIIASISGFGQTGPRADEPGHDLGYCGLAGALSLGARYDGVPALPALPIADLAGGALTAAMTICGALFARERTGDGRWLDLSMTEGVLAMMAPFLAAAAEGHEHPPGQTFLTGGWARYGLHRCADDRLISLAAIEDRFWERLGELLGGPVEEDAESLAARFAERSRDDWAQLLAPACVTPVLELKEVLTHSLHQQRGAWRGEGASQRVAPPFFSDPETVTRPAPALGEANGELLAPAAKEP